MLRNTVHDPFGRLRIRELAHGVCPPAHPQTVSPAAIGSAERWLSWVALALILVALVIRTLMLFHASLGKDEVEHLHAAWAVAQGQVPYRDFLQLHTPLLYYLLAPIFALMGEELRIIFVGRGLMLLCILLILLQLYWIARKCFDALTGILAVLLLSYLLLWWPPVYEFRPDIPQTLLVLMSLWQFMRAWKRQSRTEFLAAGALLGVGFWLLTKTLFPLVGLALVFAVSSSLKRSHVALWQNLQGAVLSWAGSPSRHMLLLWYAGALRIFGMGGCQCALSPERFPIPDHLMINVHGVFWGLALSGMVVAVTRVVRARVAAEVQLSPLLAGSVTAAVWLFLMPAPYQQSALPFLPLAAMYGADVLRRVVGRAMGAGTSGLAAQGESAVPFLRSPARLAWAALAGLLLVGACGLPLLALGAQPLQDRTAHDLQRIRYVLAITSPGDSVFDSFGGYIFRPHATYYYRLSNVVIIWLRSGVIPESDIMNDLQRSQCKVVMAGGLSRLPPALLQFLRSHYVATGPYSYGVLVAGWSSDLPIW
jgi:hypothetical protein